MSLLWKTFNMQIMLLFQKRSFKKMIIFFADGRLGNQIFQYVFLKTIQKNNERILVSGFDEFLTLFSIDDKTLLHFSRKNRIQRNLLYRIIKPFLYKVADVKLINSLTIKYEKILNNYRRESTSYIRSKGLVNRITLVKTAFFQSESLFNKELVNNLKIKNVYLKKAKTFLSPLKNNYLVFAHIRKGDYKNVRVYGKDVLLPMKYFHYCIKWFLENRKNCYFVFLSDEPEFIEKEFEYLNNKIISKNSYEVDFAIMTMCNGAILSPSSFGWWGSYLMKNRDVVFVPMFWLGWSSKIEYHKGAVAGYMREVEI
ncbi:alpha-1,2-fucosyltransferase [Spirochaetia bacterium 38H-sp]|uniref:Alpha-1,2-fucosyltransferase n=1 Tax=Rarispira pelagica TaxID=3141764 RepID=A0ABU9UBA7_9SPIR